jgi:hypothetical protein
MFLDPLALVTKQVVFIKLSGEPPCHESVWVPSLTIFDGKRLSGYCEKILSEIKLEGSL